MQKISLEQLNPYVRRAGKQNSNGNRTRVMKIYDHKFMYCLNGRATIKIENHTIEIKPGCLVFVTPNKPHIFWKDENDPAEIIWIHFDFIFRNDVFQLINLLKTKNYVLFSQELPLRQYIRPEMVLENGLSFPKLIQVEQKSIVESIFKKIFYAFADQTPYWKLDCKILILELFNILFKQFLQPGCMHAKRDGNEIAEIVMNFVHNNHYRKFSLSEISQILGLSSDHIGKIFKKETGETIIRYTNQVRLQYAALMIKTQDLSMTDIAEACGFNDIYYFSKVVKKYKGVSPVKWKGSLTGEGICEEK